MATALLHREHHHRVLSVRARVPAAAAAAEQADITRALLWAGTTTVGSSLIAGLGVWE